MNMRTLGYLAGSLFFLFTVACSSTQKTEEASGSARGSDVKMLTIPEAEAKLKNARIIGFPPFSKAMPMEEFDQFGAEAAKIVKEVSLALPPGYIIELKGHANQHDSKSKKYTQTLSEERANFALEYFVARGVARDMLKAIGVGDKEDNPKLSHAELRRVNFKIIKKK